MFPKTPTPRGMALVMAMIVIVLITLLVAGAISFTGTERAASEVQAQQDTLSSCVQAARNMFVSQMNMLDAEGPSRIVFDRGLRYSNDDPHHPWKGVRLTTGHFSQLNRVSAADVSGAMKDPHRDVQDISNSSTHKPQTRFYTVTAVCQETDDATSPEREIEFMVRVGL
jgi:type II secretory pathway pseudopilin PulG